MWILRRHGCRRTIAIVLATIWMVMTINNTWFFQEKLDLASDHSSSAEKLLIARRTLEARQTDSSRQEVQDASATRVQLLLNSINRTLEVLQKVNSSIVDTTSSPQWYMLFDCAYYKREYSIRRHVVYSQWTKLNTYTEEDITLSVHTTLERYKVLDQMIRYWNGPVTASIYIGYEHLEFLTAFVEKAKVWLNKNNVDLHFVPKQGELYPVNFMRNVAFNFTKTRYAFNCDIDFVPKPNLYKELFQSVVHDRILTKDNMVLVVPPFEFTSENMTRVPNTKSEIITLWDEGYIRPFHFADHPSSYRTTNYSKWRSATQPYIIDWEIGYEPYVLGLTKKIPPFNEKFVGRGQNKISHILELYARGFDFMVLPDVYMVHMTHSYSNWFWYKRCPVQVMKEHMSQLELEAESHGRKLGCCQWF